MKRYTYLVFLIVAACNTGIPARDEDTSREKKNVPETPASKPLKQEKTGTSQSRGSVIPADTSSIYYMQYLLNNNKSLTPYLKEKLIAIDSSWFTEGIGASLFVKELYHLNDTIEVMHMEFGTDVGLEEYILTFKNDHEFLNKLQISESYDRNLSREEYSYKESQIEQDSLIKITLHTLYGPEESTIDSTLVKYWKITGSGTFTKITE